MNDISSSWLALAEVVALESGETKILERAARRFWGPEGERGGAESRDTYRNWQLVAMAATKRLSSALQARDSEFQRIKRQATKRAENKAAGEAMIERLVSCICAGTDEELRDLLALGAMRIARNAKDRFPDVLLHAVVSGSLWRVGLVARDADVDAEGSAHGQFFGLKPLDIAVCNGSQEIAALLLSLGAARAAD